MGKKASFLSLQRARPRRGALDVSTAKENWLAFTAHTNISDPSAEFSQCERPHSQLHAGSAPGRKRKILQQMICYTALGAFSVGKLCSFWALLWMKRQTNTLCEVSIHRISPDGLMMEKPLKRHHASQDTNWYWFSNLFSNACLLLSQVTGFFNSISSHTILWDWILGLL